MEIMLKTKAKKETKNSFFLPGKKFFTPPAYYNTLDIDRNDQYYL